MSLIVIPLIVNAIKRMPQKTPSKKAAHLTSESRIDRVSPTYADLVHRQSLKLCIYHVGQVSIVRPIDVTKCGLEMKMKPGSRAVSSD